MTAVEALISCGLQSFIAYITVFNYLKHSFRDKESEIQSQWQGDLDPCLL